VQKLLEDPLSLARMGLELSFRGPDPACGISERGGKKAVRDRTNRSHKNIVWDSNKQWASLQGPSIKRLQELLELNMNQLR
jgi:hypothetical protein